MSLHCWKNLRLVTIMMLRSLNHCTLSSLMPFVSYSNFLVLVRIFKMWHLLTLRGISHLSDNPKIFWGLPGGSSCGDQWFSCFWFLYHLKVWNKVIYSDIDVIYVNNEHDWSESSTLRDTACNWCTIYAVPLKITQAFAFYHRSIGDQYVNYKFNSLL